MRWRILALVLVASLLSFWFVWAQSEKRVTIELKDAPIVDAFDQLFRAAGENFILLPSVPKEQRLTMRLVDVPFEKALNFLCDLTGLKWERKEGIYVISATKSSFFLWVPVPPVISSKSFPTFKDLERIFGAQGIIQLFTDQEFWQELTEWMQKWGKRFDFPHVTILMRCPKCGTSVQRTCPQCKRPMQLYWQFCPFDRAKLPPAPEKCPKCGEQLLKTPMIVKVDTIDDELIFLFPWGITIQVLDEQGKVLVERKLEPQARGHFLGLSNLLGEKPKTGTYQLRLLKEGQEIAVISIVKR